MMMNQWEIQRTTNKNTDKTQQINKQINHNTPIQNSNYKNDKILTGKGTYRILFKDHIKIQSELISYCATYETR